MSDEPEAEPEPEPAPPPEDPQRGWCLCGLSQRRFESEELVRDCLRIAAERREARTVRVTAPSLESQSDESEGQNAGRPAAWR